MRAIIADDHELFRGGVRQLLTAEFPGTDVSEAPDLATALGMIETSAEPYELLIADINMPGVEGVDSIAALSEAAPDAKVVIMSASEARLDVLDALAAGIDGYVPKSLGASEIASALREVLEGRIFVPSSLARRDERTETQLRRAQRGAGLSSLTERQRDVLGELMQGKSSKQIGRALDLAEGTVKIHLAAIYRALGVKSRAEAIAKVGAASR